MHHSKRGIIDMNTSFGHRHTHGHVDTIFLKSGKHPQRVDFNNINYFYFFLYYKLILISFNFNVSKMYLTACQ